MKKEHTDKLISDINETADKTDFSGVVSINCRESLIYSKTFGFRDYNNKIPNNIETKFGIASGTKLFTALGIGKLIEEKKLSLNTKVKEINNNYCNFIDGNATIQNLLNHTSGIFDYYDEETIEDFDNYKVNIPWFELETPSDYFPLFVNEQMKFKPDERFSYSNGGYIFLGIIIERITGQLFRDFIRENVLKPGQMVNSGFFALNKLPENTANGYLEDRKTTNIFNLPIRGAGDGGMFTTADDLHSFWKNLFSFKILSQDLTEQFLKTQYRFKNNINGYGSGIYKKIDDSTYYIVGSDAGVGFDSRYLIKEGISINIMSNITDGEIEMRKTIIKELEN